MNRLRPALEDLFHNGDAEILNAADQLAQAFGLDAATALAEPFCKRIGGIQFSFQAFGGRSDAGPCLAFCNNRVGLLRRCQQQFLWRTKSADDGLAGWRSLGERLQDPERFLNASPSWPDGGLWALQRQLWRMTGFQFDRPLGSDFFFGEVELRQHFRMPLLGSIQSGVLANAQMEAYLAHRANCRFLCLFVGRYTQGVGSMEGSRRTLVPLPLEPLGAALRQL